MSTVKARLRYPRGLFIGEETNGDLLVLDRGGNYCVPGMMCGILSLWDADGDGVSSQTERALLLHGYVFASVHMHSQRAATATD